jgi:hypothetical protein
MNERKARLDEITKIVRERGEIPYEELLGLTENMCSCTKLTFDGYLATLSRAGVLAELPAVYDYDLKQWTRTNRIIKAK